MSHPFATPSQLATFLGRGVDTAQAMQALELASEQVRQVAGQPIDFARDTYTLPSAGRYVYLPHAPVVADSDNPVVVDGFDPRAWVLDAPRVALHRLVGIWPLTVTVTYSHGFHEVPGTIRQVVLAAAARQIQNPEGFSSYTVGGLNVSWASREATDIGMLTAAETRAVRRFFGGSSGMVTIA